MVKHHRRSCVRSGEGIVSVAREKYTRKAWLRTTYAMKPVATVALQCVLLQMGFNVSCLCERHRRKDHVWQDTMEALTSHVKYTWGQRAKVHAVPETTAEPRDLGTWGWQLAWRGKRDREVPTCCGNQGRHSLHVTIRERQDSRVYIFLNGAFKRTWKIVVRRCNKVLVMLIYCREYWSVSCHFRRCDEATSNHNQKHVVTSVMSLRCALQVRSRSFEVETYVSEGKRISKHARRPSSNLRDASAVNVIFHENEINMSWQVEFMLWQSDNTLAECWRRRRKLSFLTCTQKCDMMFDRKTTGEISNLGSFVRAGKVNERYEDNDNLS